MYFEQFYLGCLAHASYMLGSDGIGVVVDPQRDIEIYVKAADEQHLQIKYIIETHLHADFVSGHLELAKRTGAEICIGAQAGAKFPHKPMWDGVELEFGRCKLRVLETPGHTPESICVAVFDPERGPAPWAVLTGDTLFIGDVGRPDLSPAHTPQELAGMLYDSLHDKLLALPDATLVYPAHGAGSLCGRNMRAERSSTIGTERLTNHALQIASRQAFITAVTANLPARPEYFLEDASLNREGAHALTELPEPPALEPHALHALLQQEVFVLDTRKSEKYAEAHVPGSICIGLTGQFASWAGSIIGLHTPIVMVAESAECMREARMRLARVGIENVIGWLAGGIAAWEQAGFGTASLPQITVEQLRTLLENGSTQVLDVRREAEWQAGHIGGAQWHPLDIFPRQLPRTADSEQIAVHCKSGYRSLIAAGLLMRAGFRDVTNVLGGFDAWTAAGYPVSHDPRAERLADRMTA